MCLGAAGFLLCVVCCVLCVACCVLRVVCCVACCASRVACCVTFCMSCIVVECCVSWVLLSAAVPKPLLQLVFPCTVLP